ncbi:glycogen/starch/alpha-glucan phosphorylase [Agaribacterium haliotis]|uniref:glycogen/starch/alpha-glucan phosphorylase n=1 Tax=Agaribacterium haliotis TaxID=2013869 RepID=UPI000BB59530|nr:glycogen/starch/alpha-glucan phosphorylase [Agaribacterium haliotis]
MTVDAVSSTTGSDNQRVNNNDSNELSSNMQHHLLYTLGCFDHQKAKDWSQALALAVRDHLMHDWQQTRLKETTYETKRGFYLSLEFLLGRSMNNAVMSMGLRSSAGRALQELGQAYEELESEERDAGLGNGGLGRLAACFMDSCAALALPVRGYGIRYEYGMFHQSIREGRQFEQPDHWLMAGNPWEIEQADRTCTVKFYGRSEFYVNDAGASCKRWVDTHDVLAVPYDMPIPGYKNGVVNTLRLWKAAATHEFNLQDFNDGDYADAVAQKNLAEQITMVLYPNDASENGKELRLRQQYFLASASLQDVISEWCVKHGDDFSQFAKFHCFQLNDTHPTLAVAELMRLLIDEHGLEWDEAWEITTGTMAYTNHTLLPEALERWPVRLLGELLPRLLDIIYEINARFLAEVAHRWPGDVERQRRMSLIEEGQEPHVRMAYLGIVGSFSVNGVAALHSELLTRGLFRDFFALWPEKFNNKTNGVTPRRWLAHCNPGLKQLIDSCIGKEWVCELDRLEHLKNYADDAAFQQQWMDVKQDNKRRLAALVKDKCGVDFDEHFIFDIQVKRIHEYKRQLLNVLHVIHLYDKITRGDAEQVAPRCVLIGGKAAPGYFLAKLTIKLINNVAAVINSDERVSERLRLAFLPNYNVSAMEIITPAADLSEQISTAGKEASGTGNMKFMMNGALTIGTYDGANIEILDAVGEEHFFLFGLKEDQIVKHRMQHSPSSIVENDLDLARVIGLLQCGHFSMFEEGIFQPLIDSVLNPHDPWMTAADFRSYVDAQQRAADAYENKKLWTRSSILNTAMSGKFSSDRTIREYAQDIWKIV